VQWEQRSMLKGEAGRGERSQVGNTLAECVLGWVVVDSAWCRAACCEVQREDLSKAYQRSSNGVHAAISITLHL
jgi:hypothetical protein